MQNLKEYLKTALVYISIIIIFLFGIAFGFLTKEIMIRNPDNPISNLKSTIIESIEYKIGN